MHVAAAGQDALSRVRHGATALLVYGAPRVVWRDADPALGSLRCRLAGRQAQLDDA
ncbi:MAG TPA: hypothetical protein VF046_07175 [Gemmatimonadales bacterium]